MIIQLTPELSFPYEFIILALPSMPISDPKVAKTFEFLLRGTFSLQLLKRLSGNFPSDVKIFVEASFYAAQWTNKNSTVNIQDGPASLSK